MNKKMFNQLIGFLYGALSIFTDLLFIVIQIVLRCEIFECDNISEIDELLEYITENRLISKNNKFTDERIIPMGLCFGKWYITYILPKDTDKNKDGKTLIHIFMICWKIPGCLSIDKFGKNGKKELIEIKDSKKQKRSITLQIFEKSQPYNDSEYIKRNLNILRKSYQYQVEIAKKIIEIGRERCKSDGKHSCTILINGPPGLGKSYIGRILACMLGANVCLDFNPGREGDWFMKLFKKSKANKEKPLVVMFDEADFVAQKITKGETPQKRTYMNYIRDKHEWNSFFDILPDYRHVYFIMTANRPICDIDGNGEKLNGKPIIDPALFRPGRVHGYFSIGDNTKTKWPNHYIYAIDDIKDEKPVPFSV